MPNNITKAKNDAIGAASGYTDGKVKIVSDALDAHAQSASTKFGTIDASLVALGTWSAETDTAVKTTLPDAITTAKENAINSGKSYTDSKVKEVSDDLDALSSKVVKEVVVNNLSGVTTTNKDNTVTLNFEELVIDCGEF